jgi:hypothetical protein
MNRRAAVKALAGGIVKLMGSGSRRSLEAAGGGPIAPKSPIEWANLVQPVKTGTDCAFWGIAFRQLVI